MAEKMHLSGLDSPILHRPRVKEVKDANVREIYSSLLLSPLSPIPPCATRIVAIPLRIYVRVGERAKEAQIDTPNPFRAGRATFAQVRTTPARSDKDSSVRHTLPSLLPTHGSFLANGDGDRGGNGQEQRFCLLGARTQCVWGRSCLGLAWRDAVGRCKAWRSSAGMVLARHDSDGLGGAWHGSAGQARPGGTLRGKAGLGLERHGEVGQMRFGGAWPYQARHDMAWQARC